MSTSDRDANVLAERIHGATLSDLAERYGLSIEGARKVVVREGRRHLDRLELDLMVAAKTKTDYPVLLVPHQEQDGWQAALGLPPVGARRPTTARRPGEGHDSAHHERHGVHARIGAMTDVVYDPPMSTGLALKILASHPDPLVRIAYAEEVLDLSAASCLLSPGEGGRGRGAKDDRTST